MKHLLLITTCIFTTYLAISQTYTEHIIYNASSISANAADLDGDTDFDIVYVDGNSSLAHLIVAEKIADDVYVHDTIAFEQHEISTIRTADIDNDLDLDIVVGSYNDSIYVFTNNGGLTFQKTSFYVAGYHSDLEVGHFNSDNLVDIVFTSRSQGFVYVMENTGSTFIPHLVSNAIDYPAKLDTADFNGNGLLDIVVTGVHGTSGAGGIYLLQNNDNFNYTSNTISTIGNYDVFVKNIDGDSDFDLGTANTYNGEISYWINNGGMNFTQNVIQSLSCCALTILMEDMDNDGDIDIISGDEEYAGIMIHTNDGSLNFSSDTISDYDPYEIQIFDEDNDGDLDILVASYGSTVSLFENDLYAATLEDITEKNSPLSVYPNPSSGLVTLSINNSSSIDNIKIMDQMGRTVMARNFGENIINLDISKMATGLYFVISTIDGQLYKNNLEIIK